ncbi:putative ATPase/DNA-binding CsgD family transcriptional regulator [Streptomyces africanus]|uniref:ATPase/DNA-binding CsgD family transcriptional regulator n=1 Tax=Streptomyces africanus TaxID=231024 RepID=A0ABU0QWN9_9ACTN|nr:LuxR C-terminal-related transcriptional regulator [Streptomyces africanus]MDQ0750959.1 putative ATPase/DNA-binding CsgD family transcriptional regulator [Streptomyces africanus]
MGGSAPRRDHQLPVETTSFVDRRGELTQGRELLARARLVTLTGPGGVGKTRLAARIAARVRRAFPDGVRFVHLSGLHDPALVPLAAADALGLHDHSAQPPPAALVEQVRDRRLLLVVDNCEHLAGACAQLAAALLHGTEGVRVLATSRHRLGLTEEHLLEVRPLPVPDPDGDLSAAEGYPALTLFADRAAAVVPGFRLTPDNRASVARLCRRLDGLPLAIELAAVRMRVLDVDQLLDRLDDRYRFLTTGSPAALPRHQTLRAAVAWSHDLCTGPEQLVWARLSVLAGSFDLATAEAVCADDIGEPAAGRGTVPARAEALLPGGARFADGSCELTRPVQAFTGTVTLGSLVTPVPAPAGGPVPLPAMRSESLITPSPGSGPGGGLTLPPPVQGPAAPVVPPPAAGAAGAWPGTWTARPAPPLRADDVLDAVAGLVDKSVLCREPGPGGVRYRMLDTLRQYGLEQVRRNAGEEGAARRRQRDRMLRWAEECERGWFGPGQPETVARLRADRDNLRAALDFSLSTPGEARAGLRLAGTLWFYWHACGAPREGLYWLDRALAANPEPTPERARGLWVAGLLAAATQDFPRGRRDARDALALARVLGDAAEAAHAEYVIGVLRLFGDDLPGALRHFETTVARGPVPGQHLSVVGLDQVELACTLGFLGEADRAVEVCERALGLCERHGEQWVRSYVLRILALAHSVRRDWARAERHAREALRLKLAVHDVIGIALTLDLLASIATERGAHRHAAVLLGGADRVWADIDAARWGARTLNAARRDSEERACRALGRDAFERAHRRGAGLGLADLVGQALQEPARPHPRVSRAPHDDTPVRLTRRETEVARLVAEGLANQQIADRLVIARRTAEGHVERILSKLGFSNRSQIAAWVTAQR